MKKVLVNLFLLAQVVCAETYVHPLRADLGIEDKTAMLPHETYTGTTSWAVGNLASNELIDFSPARNNMRLVDANCVVIDGSDWLNVAGLLVTDAVTCDGTATPTAEADKITFSNGTVYNIEVSRGGTVIARFFCAGGRGMGLVEPNVLGDSDYDGTWSTDDVASLRSGLQSEKHHNLKEGCSKVLAFDGVSSQCVVAPSVASALDDFTMVFLMEETTGSAQYLWSGSVNEVDNRINITDDSLYVEIDNVGVTDADAITRRQWNRIVISRSGSTVTIKVNDSKESGFSLSGSVDLRGTVGRRGSAFGEFNLGEFALYNRAWTSAEITAYEYGVISADAIALYSTKSSYGTTLPDSTGNNDATLENVDFKYVPADQSDPTKDTDGNPLTNPRGYAHNNSESSIVIGATTNSYANLLTNSVNIVTNSAGLITEFYE